MAIKYLNNHPWAHGRVWEPHSHALFLKNQHRAWICSVSLPLRVLRLVNDCRLASLSEASLIFVTWYAKKRRMHSS